MGVLLHVSLDAADTLSGVSWQGRVLSQLTSQAGSFVLYRERQKELFDAWRHTRRDGSGDAVEPTRICVTHPLSRHRLTWVVL